MSIDLSEKQIEYMENATLHRWNIKVGATGAGKTYMDFFWLSKRITDCTGQGLIVMIGNTRTSLIRNIIEPMRGIYNTESSKIIGEHVHQDGSIKMFNKTVFLFGADKVTSVQKIQGATIEYCYGDEVTTWNQEIFEMLKSRLRCPNSCFDGTCNPDSPSHWFKKFLESDADIYQQHYVIDDNPFLTDKFKEELKREYAGTVYYKRFILGLWAIAEGLVYSIFDSDKHTFDGEINYNQSSQYYLAVDYGTMNPFAVLLIELTYNGVVRVLKCGGHSGRDTGVVLDNEAYYTILRDVAKGFPIEAIIIDPSAAGMKATIQKYGEFAIRDGNNDVLNGIQEVVKYMNLDFLKIHVGCKELIDEFGAYAYDDKASATGKDTVIKENDHFCDALRYFIYTIAKIYNRGII